MKKLLALAVAAAFTLPTFAITLETGDTVTAGSSTLYVTKIAQSAQANAYDLVIQDGNVIYNYSVANGDTIKIKNIEYRVSSVGRNTVTIDPKETSSTISKTKSSTKSSSSSSKYIDAK